MTPTRRECLVARVATILGHENTADERGVGVRQSSVLSGQRRSRRDSENEQARRPAHGFGADWHSSASGQMWAMGLRTACLHCFTPREKMSANLVIGVELVYHGQYPREIWLR